mmetsp:Transcript_19476/g.56786  ORF Transcript_19476/g.56786 Transcript_19476/m.56786 type:complete len:262 (+) Transcript_19476:660-1445(+)
MGINLEEQQVEACDGTSRVLHGEGALLAHTSEVHAMVAILWQHDPWQHNVEDLILGQGDVARRSSFELFHDGVGEVNIEGFDSSCSLARYRTVELPLGLEFGLPLTFGLAVLQILIQLGQALVFGLFVGQLDGAGEVRDMMPQGSAGILHLPHLMPQVDDPLPLSLQEIVRQSRLALLHRDCEVLDAVDNLLGELVEFPKDLAGLHHLGAGEVVAVADLSGDIRAGVDSGALDQELLDPVEQSEERRRVGHDAAGHGSLLG